MTEQGGELHCVYAHGTVTIRTRLVSDETCELDFLTDIRDAQVVSCQLPVLITSSMRFATLGNPPQPAVLNQAEWTTRTLDHGLVLTRADREVRVVIHRPQDAALRFHFPVHPGFGWQEDELFTPTFAVGLLSAQFSTPNGKKQLTYRIVLEPVD